MDCQHMAVFPSGRSATVKSEARISQNKGISLESDISSYNKYDVNASLSHKEKFTVHIRQPHRLFKKQKPVGDAIINKS